MVAKDGTEHEAASADMAVNAPVSALGLREVDVTVEQANEFRRWMDDPNTPVAGPARRVPRGAASFLHAAVR